MKNPEDNLISVMTNKEITQLYKTLLEIVEDLQKDHEVLMDKVSKKTSPDFANDINYFTKIKYEQLRKRILDSGNECNRNLLNFLSFFDSTINVQRLNEANPTAPKHQVIFKKTIISPPVMLQ